MLHAIAQTPGDEACRHGCTAPPHTHSTLSQVHAGDASFLSKLGRVFKEKAQGDFERLFQGTSKARERLNVRPDDGSHTQSLTASILQVVEELFTYWNLDEADEYLEELEEALIVRSPDQQPSTH